MNRTLVSATAIGVLVSVVGLTAPVPGLAGEKEVLALETLPPGYRDWKLISVAHEEGSIGDIRAILGNDIAAQASRDGVLPYPDGSIIARIAWSYDGLAESSKAFGHLQSFVAGAPKNGVQFMVKDPTKFASTGGWGFVQFNGDNPATKGTDGACYSCHAIVKARDSVFSRYAH
jgi:hypothetical protein